MNSRDDGGRAFPMQYDDGAWQTGLSLRDYFASMAMQAAATNPTGADGFSFEERATWAYQQADAMLVERAK